MTLMSNIHMFLAWIAKKFRYNPIEQYLAQSVDRADYVARYKNLRHRGLL